MENGGFDVVVGNPPYVSRKSLQYNVMTSPAFPDIYAYVVLRGEGIKHRQGKIGFIVPMSLAFSYAFSELRHRLTQYGTHWFSVYDNIPAPLFSGVSQRCLIWISDFADKCLYTTGLLRWRANFRACLLETITYTEISQGVRIGEFGIPRIPSSDSRYMLDLHIGYATQQLGHSVSYVNPDSPATNLRYSPTGRNFISTYLKQPPVMQLEDDELLADARGGPSVALASAEMAFASLAATSGDVCFWYWLVRGDGFHVTNRVLADYLMPLNSFPEEHLQRLIMIGELLHKYRFAALVFKKNAGKFVGNYNYRKLDLLSRRADMIFLSGLGAEWEDIEQLFSTVSLVRAVNESTGEKSIPKFIKERFLPPDMQELESREELSQIDLWLSESCQIEVERIALAVQI